MNIRTKLRFEVHLTEHCNLNCYSCHHFSPLAEPFFLDLTKYEADCSRLAFLFNGKCEHINLLGGEPLLHPELVAVMEMTRRYFTEGDINLVTNGILLKKMNDDFWQACHRYNIKLKPTKYPINCDYDYAEDKAKKYGVFYCVWNKNDEYRYTMNRYPLTVDGSENVEQNFFNCNLANNCIELRSGRMYTCPFVAYADHLITYFNLENSMNVSESDSVDIYKANSSKEIMKFLAQPIPFCRFCKVNVREYGIPFQISKKIKEEWLDD